MGQKQLLLTPVGVVLFIMKPSEINRDARKYYEKGEKNILFPCLISPIKISKIKQTEQLAQPVSDAISSWEVTACGLWVTVIFASAVWQVYLVAQFRHNATD